VLNCVVRSPDNAGLTIFHLQDRTRREHALIGHAVYFFEREYHTWLEVAIIFERDAVIRYNLR
jgi:hypothetical protein